MMVPSLQRVGGEGLLAIENVNPARWLSVLFHTVCV